MVPQADTVAPPKEGVKPMTPKQELESLRAEVLVLGMSSEELALLREVGECPEQIQDQIRALKARRKGLLNRGQ